MNMRSRWGTASETPGGVAHRGHVTHLGHPEDPLVLRVRAGHTAEDVDVLHRGQPLELELGQASEPQALGDHGVEAPVEQVFAEALRPAAEREVLQRRLPLSVAGGPEGDAHPVQGSAAEHGVERRAHRLRVLVRWRERSRAPEVEVEDHVLVRRYGRDVRQQRA